MSLGKQYESLSPKTSWWIVPTREAFMASRDAELERMSRVPKVGLVVLEGSGKMSRPEHRRRGQTEVCE